MKPKAALQNLRQGIPGKWTLRYLEDAPMEKSTCGHRHRLLSDGDGTSAFAHLVRIHDASPHFHKQTTELYYVVEGAGTMSLDGEEVPLRPGAAVEIQPGVVHSARGDLLVLVVGMPSISEEDTFIPKAAAGEPNSLPAPIATKPNVRASPLP
jgi:mannose-6-phosphate isomerase-like protein (cupin superfamily)